MEPCTFLQLFPFVPPDVLGRLHEFGNPPALIVSTGCHPDSTSYQQSKGGASPVSSVLEPRYEPLKGVE